MSLSSRLQQVRQSEQPAGGAAPTEAPISPAAPATLSRIQETKAADAANAALAVEEVGPSAGLASEALRGLRERASQALYERLGARLSDSSMDEAELHRHVRAELKEVVEAEQVPLSAAERKRLTREIIDDVLGHGPIQRFLDDPDVTEIMVNSHDSIYVERFGTLQETDARFSSDQALRRVIERIVSRVGRRIDESSPLVDARLADGSRVNAIIPPLAVNGPSLTIRKFSREALTVARLIELGTLSPEMAELLQACVLARMNIIVSGGTGTGKTTMLNVLSSFIPESDRIVTIEDAVELQLQQRHVVRLESRPANIEGRGEVSIRELVRNSLRMRPDRIVVGEVRGGESMDMLQAMNTGHDGSISTVHANSPRDAVARLETLVLMAGLDLPLRAVREQLASAVNLIVHITRLRDGTRRVTHITEVQGMEGDVVTLQDAFVFDYAAGIDAYGRFLGNAVPTGIRPRFTDRFAELGIPISPAVFGSVGSIR
jgi:pilus assembly protein CpaF